MDKFTTGEVITLAIGGILALAGAISTIGGAVEKIVKARKAIRAPEQKQDDEISKIKERLDRVERELSMDEKNLKDVRECNHVITKGVLALLDHSINGNNIDQMREARHDVEVYLINH